MIHRLLLTILLGLLVAGCGPQVVSVPSISNPLKPQAYTWYPERSVSGPVLVFVSIPRQEATVYRNGIRIGRSAVSTGRPGHSTPTGVFQILQKDVDHHSKTYNNAPMPYMERLTWDGVALHAGFNPGHPDSHGCVRLPAAFAKDNQWHTVEGNASFSNMKDDLRVSDTFRDKIRAVVHPGTTMVITSEPISPRGATSRAVIGSD